MRRKKPHPGWRQSDQSLWTQLSRPALRKFVKEDHIRNVLAGQWVELFDDIIVHTSLIRRFRSVCAYGLWLHIIIFEWKLLTLHEDVIATKLNFLNQIRPPGIHDIL